MTMVTDDERRKVARRLRELHLGGGSKDLIERTLSDAIGAWRRSGMSWDFITERLADLIEPSIPADPGEAGLASVEGFIRERTEKPVDRDALLELADEIEAGFRLECSTGPAHMVVDLVNIEMGKLAHRIREACGGEASS